MASGARRKAAALHGSPVPHALWPSYSTWMGISYTYARMAVEEDREAAREVGLPLSTSLARSSWIKVQNTKRQGLDTSEPK